MITDIRNLIAARRAEENDEGGFTLIELLIVIVVLGILAAIVVFAVQNVAGDSAKSACKTDAKTLEVAQEARKAKTGTYATNVGPGTAATETYLVPEYVKAAPGNTTRYTISTGTDGIIRISTFGTGGVTNIDHNAASKPCDTVA